MNTEEVFCSLISVRRHAATALMDQAMADRDRSDRVIHCYGKIVASDRVTHMSIRVEPDQSFALTFVERDDTPDDPDVALYLSARGSRVRQAGTTILDVFGLSGEDDDGIALARDFLTQRQYARVKTFHLSPGERQTEEVLACWSGLPQSGPVVFIHAPDGSTDKAQAFYRAAVPSFIAPVIPGLVLDSAARRALNASIDHEEPRVSRLPRGGALVAFRDQGRWVTASQGNLVRSGERSAYQAVRAAMRVCNARMESTNLFERSRAEGAEPDLSEQIETVLAEADSARAETERATQRLRSVEQTLAELRRENARLARTLTEASSTTKPTTSEPEVSQQARLRVVATPEPERPPVPDTFVEMFAQARESFARVVLSEDLESQSDPLKHFAKTGTWIERTWLILESLDGYAQARERGEPVRNFRHYLEGLPHPPFPPGQVSLQESAAVRRGHRFRKSRVFALPTEVDPSGRGDFTSHVRIDSGGRGTVAPRLHFYDDTSGPTGRVYVGYAGPHLPNTLTN